MVDPAIERLRGICLALPEAYEQETWENPTFRVRAKIFTMVRQRDGQPAIWCKARPGEQEILVRAEPTRFFVPPYVGPKGWIGMCLDDDVDWDEVTDHVIESYRMTVPKRLAALIDISSDPMV